jgi:hypothetical protein
LNLATLLLAAGARSTLDVDEFLGLPASISAETISL